MKSVLLSLVITCFMTAMLKGTEPSYTPSRIDELVRSGLAKEHGAQFANQGLGCRTYLWTDSKEHHVFVFLRDGISYGEFRDEVLQDGRFLSISEQYLVAESRAPEIFSNAKELPFVCRQEQLTWKDTVCIGSVVRWSFVTTDRSGNVIKREDTVEKNIVRGVISVIFPDHLTPSGEKFFVGLERKNLTEHEIAMGSVDTVVQTFGLSNRRCSIWAEWPEDDPQGVVVLEKELPKDPADNFPEPRRKIVASMGVKLAPPENVPFVFTADQPTALPSLEP